MYFLVIIDRVSVADKEVVVMKRIIKRIILLGLVLAMLYGMSIISYAKDIIAMDGSLLFSGSNEECETYSNYVRPKYMNAGGGYMPDGTIICLTYAYGDNYIRFDFETKKMTWIDGSKWKITANVPANQSQSGLIVFADDAVKMFCPDFAATHSLIPDDAPGNFQTVVDKARSYNDKRLGITRTVINVDDSNNVAESFETFDAVSYANTYADLKEAFGTDKSALWKHYKNYGKEEGRTAKFMTISSTKEESIKTFDATDYANRYPDVKKVFGTDKSALWKHYQTYGKAEGRIANFK